MTITASVVSQPITAAVSGGGAITANVGSSTVSAAVSGGIGPQGPAGVSGASSVTDSIPSRFDIFPRGFVNTGLNPGSRTMVSFFSVDSAISVISLTCGTLTVASTSIATVARMGLYLFDDGQLTLLARTANDPSLFLEDRTLYTRSLLQDAEYPSTVTLSPGLRYGFAVLRNPFGGTSIAGRGVNQAVSGQQPRLNAVLDFNLDDLPHTATSLSATPIQIYGALGINV
jgi:hypothetical protein